MILEAFFSEYDKKNKYNYEDCNLIVGEYDQNRMNTLSEDDFMNIFRPNGVGA